MKKILIMLLMPFMANAQYTITGKMTGLKIPSRAYLSYDKVNDSADIRNGKFEFKGHVTEPLQVFLSVRPVGKPQSRQDDYTAFFLENSRITVTAKDSISKAVITGSVAEAESKQLEAMISPLTKTIIKLNDDFRGKPKDDAYKAAGDSVMKLVAEIKEIRRRFAETHLNSFMGLYTFHYDILDSKFKPSQVEDLYRRFSPALLASPLGKAAGEKIEVARRRQSGMKATDFTQNDLNGKPFTLSSLRGKYVLVDFWASWCVPCRAENPNLKKAYNELKGKNFEVVGVSLDQGKEVWEEAVKKDGLPWIHVCDMKGWKNEVAAMYGISSVPQNLLINPEGVIIATNLRGEDLTAKLSAYIK